VTGRRKPGNAEPGRHRTPGAYSRGPLGRKESTMNASREMPRYQSHKHVWALKIAGIEINEDGSATIAPADDGYGPFETKPGFKERWHGSEEDLGYFVQYQDGYQSWSPTKAFEDGYTLISQ
jgi:hypothetical protein